MILHGNSFHELPDIAIEAAEFLLDTKKYLRVRNSGLNLDAVAHDA